jgi:hypothetical protein
MFATLLCREFQRAERGLDDVEPGVGGGCVAVVRRSGLGMVICSYAEASYHWSPVVVEERQSAGNRRPSTAVAGAVLQRRRCCLAQARSLLQVIALYLVADYACYSLGKKMAVRRARRRCHRQPLRDQFSKSGLPYPSPSSVTGSVKDLQVLPTSHERRNILRMRVVPRQKPEFGPRMPKMLAAY